MFRPRRIASSGAYYKQKGVVLLIMLSIILVAGTTIVIAQLSRNRQMLQREYGSTLVLNQAKEALLGYALRQIPPGTLPCPDTDGDGVADTNAGSCQSQRAWLPYRSLGLDDLRDGSSAKLWYVVEPSYTVNAAGARNSSRISNVAIDNQAVAALVIAPGQTLDAQQRNSANVGNYLEGQNADANLNVYSRQKGPQNNDQLLGISLGSYWATIERRVLSEISILLKNYRAACGEYPWAATFAVSPYNSSVSLKSGNLPLNTALPENWNTGCAIGLFPAPWLVTHWQDQIYYSFCEVAEGDCITVAGDNASTANAVVMGAGVVLGAQARPSANLSDYYEDENSVLGSPYKHLSKNNHNGNFNDTLFKVAP